MPRTHRRFYALALCLLALNSGGLLWVRYSVASAADHNIRILSVQPTQDIDNADRFTLLFDAPLVEPNALNRKTNDAPFLIKPQPEGHWTWASQEKLEFILDSPLPAGCVFRIIPTNDFEERTGRKLVGDKEFVFKTRVLILVSHEFTPIERNVGHLLLRFNQKVCPSELHEHLSANYPSPANPEQLKEAAVTVLTRKPDSEIVLQLQRPIGDILNLKINGSLTGSEGNLPLGKSIEHTVRFDPVFKLDSVRVSPGQFDDASVALDFSRRLDRNQPTPRVTVTPAVSGMSLSVWWDDIHIHGDFECNRRYTATVSPDVLSDDGDTLGEPQSISFTIPDRRPGLDIDANHGILNPNGNLTIDLKSVNVPKVDISVSRVNPNNIVPHLRGARSHATSRSVVDRTIELDTKHNQPETMALDLGKLLGNPRGIYSIDTASSDDYWIDDNAIITITDLAVTAKSERDGLWAWITSLSTGKPLSGATVEVVSYNNQVLAQGKTSEDGTVQLNIPKGPDGPVWVVLARLGEDLAYLLPERRTHTFDNVDQKGREIPETYDVMLYTERGVYRPGDTVHLTGIVRDKNGQVPLSFPMEMSVLRPDGCTVETFAVSTADNKQGVFHASYTTQETAQLGRYEFELSIPGSSAPISETSALVEAFLPIRFEVKAEASSARYHNQENPELSVEAEYLFGKPAANLPVTIESRFRSIQYESARFNNFTFGDPELSAIHTSPPCKGKLDENGITTATLKPEPKISTGLWKANWCVTVTEPGSRSVSKNISAIIDNSNHHLGLKTTSGRIASPGSPIEIEWIQLTGTDELADPHPISLAVYRVEFDWVVNEIDGRFVWQSEEHLTRIQSECANAGAAPRSRGTFEVTCPDQGRYRVVATDEECPSSKAIMEFYCSTAESEADLLALEHPDQLEIVLDKESYRPGSNVEVLIRSPFPGTLLLTVETDKVTQHEVIELENPTATFDLPVVFDSLRGSAFLSGTVVRAIDSTKEKWLPHRAMGMTRLLLDHSNSQLQLKIDTPQEARPGENIEITAQIAGEIDSNGPPLIHMWAVDDGILLPTNYRCPNPNHHFFAPRESVVTTSDVYSDLLPDTKRPASMDHIGADGFEEAISLRRNPVAVRRSAPAVLWNKVVSVQADGRATWKTDLPDITGRLRVMAVAIDEDRYGSAEARVTLHNPLMMESPWPRFIAPGDDFSVPVKLFSSLDYPIDVNVAVESNGPLVFDPTHRQDNLTHIEARGSATYWLRAKATGVGPVEIKVKATGTADGHEDITVKSKGSFPSRPVSPLHSSTQFVRVKAGEPITIQPGAEFSPGSGKTRILISSSPRVELLPAIEALLGYPYGCVEQTSSGIVALLSGEDILKKALPNDIRTKSLPDQVKSGIARLQAMQTRSGGLSYWPGGTEPCLWGSAYAANVLADARKAGYEVNGQFLKSLLKYLEGMFRPGNEGTDDENIRALICCLLAKHDAPPKGWMTQLAERVDNLDLGGQVHLANAWAAAGRKDRAGALLPNDLSSVCQVVSTGGRITSPIRQEALLLRALCKLDRNHVLIPQLVNRLKESRSEGQWCNTLENATALAALAEYEAGMEENVDFTGTVRIGDTTIAEFDHLKPVSAELDLLTQPLEISITGSGSAYISIQTEGFLSEEFSKSYDRQLRVRRKWTDSEGNPVDPLNIHVGNLIHVTTTLQAPGSPAYKPVDNIAIVDALPAGLEVENPRLCTSAETDQEAGREPDRAEFLDDRVLLFTSASEEEVTFHYSLRAVCTGSFSGPPIQASCMYDSGIASISSGTKVEVKK